MVHVVSPELYRKYKDKVLELSNAIQEGRRGLSPKEISKVLGISVEDVREILSVAEKDVPLEWYREAEIFKTSRAKAELGGGRE